MPRRTDLNHVLVIGSGPIIIGQACEFDYSGTQACRVLRAEGLQVSLVNSNPATIMTDPEFADHTYVEPITADFVERVIAQQAERGNKIDALLATLGGQTALNTAVKLYENGTLDKYDVELIGADFEAIQRGEDRQKFKDIVSKVGGESARSRVCFTMDEVRETVKDLGLPAFLPTRLDCLRYTPPDGQIGAHSDDPWSGPTVCLLTLAAETVMTFELKESEKLARYRNLAPLRVRLPPRSLLIFTGDARWKFNHSIKPADIKYGAAGQRISLTFRATTMPDEWSKWRCQPDGSCTAASPCALCKPPWLCVSL